LLSPKLAVEYPNEDTARGRLQATGRVEAEPRMDVEHVARAVVYMAALPLAANVQFMTLMATKMPYIGRGSRVRRQPIVISEKTLRCTCSESAAGFPVWLYRRSNPTALVCGMLGQLYTQLYTMPTRRFLGRAEGGLGLPRETNCKPFQSYNVHHPVAWSRRWTRRV